MIKPGINMAGPSTVPRSFFGRWNWLELYDFRPPEPSVGLVGLLYKSYDFKSCRYIMKSRIRSLASQCRRKTMVICSLFHHLLCPLHTPHAVLFCPLMINAVDVCCIRLNSNKYSRFQSPGAPCVGTFCYCSASRASHEPLALLPFCGDKYCFLGNFLFAPAKVTLPSISK